MFDIFYIDTQPSLCLHMTKVCSEDEAKLRSQTRYFWLLDYLCKYENFNFLWEPVPWESKQKHVFVSQWNNNSGTSLVPRDGYNDTNYNNNIERESIQEVIFLDFNNEQSSNSFRVINNQFSKVLRTRFINSFHKTLARVINKIDSEYVWVTSSVCDYSFFDFTWHPSEWQREMLHVFSSDTQKFGDTFYIHVPTFKEQINNIKLLEWYDTINFIDDIVVPRWDIPYIPITDNSIVDTIKEYDFTDPVVLFTNNTFVQYDVPDLNLWREKTRAVIPLSTGANTVLIPRDAKTYIISQVYDYSYISKNNITYEDSPLDIVFISNGESNAERNWSHLLSITKDVPNKVLRVNNISGRAQAYQASARVSNTAWFFAVFAKLEVSKDFDWSWQPDRLQQSKHYIFHAKNPITELEYGHMAMIAYNKQLVLSNSAVGLDFTLDQEHEVVPILSGTAYYAEDISTAWRSAFREVIKLKNNITIDNEYRLSKWLSSNGTNLGKWSQHGAKDAVEYYDNVKGEFNMLKLTYEWKWLNDYLRSKHGVDV